MEVTAAVFYKDGKILLMRRAKGHRDAGSWEYPGGKIEPHEDGKECIKRELFEELNINAQIGEMLAETIYTSDNKFIHLMAYQVLDYQGTIELTEHDAMEWVVLKDLLKHEQLPPDYLISKQLIKCFSDR